MKYVEFYNNSSGKKKYLGEMRLVKGKLIMSDELVPHWPRSSSYSLLGKGGYDTLYEPEKILEALPDEFTDPSFQASQVKTRKM